MKSRSLTTLVDKKNRDSFPSLEEHNIVSHTLRIKYGINNFYFGAKVKDSHVKKALAVVCLVKTKKSEIDLAKQKFPPLPKTLTVNSLTKVNHYNTDVQLIGGKFNEQSAVMNPGDYVHGSSGPEYGTIGLIGSHSRFGLVCTTAGHVINNIVNYGNNPNKILLRDREKGVVIECSTKAFSNSSEADYAILRPTLQSESEWINFQNFNIDEPYLQPSRRDLSRPLWMLARGRAIPTRFRGLKLNAFRFAGKLYSDVIVTDPIGQKGDSGAALIDENFRVWGTLIGSKQNAFSLFMRIKTLLDNEHFIFGFQRR